MSEHELSHLTGTVVSIPDGERVDSSLLVRVESVRDTPLSDDSPVVSVSDRNENIFDVNVWENHNIHTDWKVGHWYVVKQVRGHIYQTETNEIERGLTTTSDTDVVPIDRDISPPSINNPPESDLPKNNNFQKSPAYDESRENVSTGDGATESSEPDEVLDDFEEGSILEDISNEFDL